MFSNLEIDSEQLPQYQRTTYTLLSANTPIAGVFGWMTFFIILYIATIGGFLINLPLIVNETAIVLTVELALTLLSIYWCFFSYRYKGYALREHDILYKTGVLWRKKTILPFNRIQHIETHQSVLQRKLNIKTIRLYTAGGLKADMIINGIDSKTTDKLKQFLLSKIQQENKLDEQP